MPEVRLGLTVPSFREDAEPALAVARAAEDEGLDGVFAYDHLFRLASDGSERPALECAALLGAMAAVTRDIVVGTLVARATLRPPATLAADLETVQRISGGRVIAGIGSGDQESLPEMMQFGLPFGTRAERLEVLDRCSARVRERGVPVWVAGRADHVGAIALRHGDGWNRWGVQAEGFAKELASLGELPPEFVPSWGGLVVVGADDAEARRKAERLGASSHAVVGGPKVVAAALRPYVEVGARWLVVAPVDSGDPRNAVPLARVRELLNRG